MTSNFLTSTRTRTRATPKNAKKGQFRQPEGAKKAWEMTPARRRWYARCGAENGPKCSATWAKFTPKERAARISKMRAGVDWSKRSKPFPIFYSDAERARLEARAAAVGVTLHEYLREKTLK